MPIYEYQCQHCGCQFEARRTFSEADAPIDCQRCSSTETRRKISRFNASSSGKTLTNTSSGCGGCSGGNCQSCH